MSDQGDNNNNMDQDFDQNNNDQYDENNYQENDGQQYDENGQPIYGDEGQYNNENQDENYDNYDGQDDQNPEDDDGQGGVGDDGDMNNNMDQQNSEEEEEEDDFPEYANEQNKQLNEIIKEKRRLIKEISRKIEEKTDRIKVLKDHFKSVQTELLHAQALVDQKNQEIETEDHMKQIAERQSGRIKSELVKLKKLSIEQQEKLNDVQNQIFKGNEKMDQLKIEINWNQEELEQWSLAAKQKEDDNQTLEKYKRADEVKIKELDLQIQKLTSEVGKKQEELSKEETETQTAQIELNKTAEEFKKQNEERHKLFLKWQEVTEIISRRDQAIRDAGEEFGTIKMEINQNKAALEDRKQKLQQNIDNNRKLESEIQDLEKEKTKAIEANKKIQYDIENLKANVEISKNQVSAFASDLAQKRNKISVLTQERLIRKQRLNNAQQKYEAHKIKMQNENQAAKIFEMNREQAEKKYKDNLKSKQDTQKEINTQKDLLYRQTQELFKLREKEANLYGDIQGNMAACRNLKSHINNLNQDFQRQQELLYNAEYQIQLMERKVARANGERTLDEKKDLDKEIQKAEEDNKNVKDEHSQLSRSLKDLEDDLRAVNKRLAVINTDQEKYDKVVAKLILENDMTYMDLNKIVKKKENSLVNHDTMKLEIKKIQKKLNDEMDHVFQQENKKSQLEMIMQEKEKEIQVHKDVLITENKAAEEERHKIAVELAERKTRVKNLKIKYESLVQKNVASNGEVETVKEHSQAYYVIKAAQEREELQRKGDELNAKIMKSEKELKALDNTLNHLKGWNSKYWDSFVNKGVTKEDRSQKEALDEQCRAASENLFKKKKNLTKMRDELDEDKKQFEEINNKMERMEHQLGEISQQIDRVNNDLNQQQDKLERSYKNMNKMAERAVNKNVVLAEENPHVMQFMFDQETQLNKALISGIMNLLNDVPELQGIVETTLKEQNIDLPSRAPSSIGVQSQVGSVRSIQSGRSQQSRGSRASSRGSRRNY